MGKRLYIESNDEMSTVEITLIERTGKGEGEGLVLRLDTPQTDPKVLMDYPDSRIVWQSIVMDEATIEELHEALDNWLKNDTL